MVCLFWKEKSKVSFSEQSYWKGGDTLYHLVMHTHVIFQKKRSIESINLCTSTLKFDNIHVYNVTKTWLCKTGYARLELDHCVYKVYKSFPPKICDMFCVVELTIV